MSEIRIASIKEVGRRLQEAREEAGLSRLAFAKELGIDSAGYKFWEEGRREGGFHSVCRAGALLNRSPNALFLEQLSDIESPDSDGLPDETLHTLRRSRERIAQIYKHTGGQLRVELVIAQMLDEIAQQVMAQPAIPFGTVIRSKGGFKTYSSSGNKVQRAASRSKNSSTGTAGEDTASYGRDKKA